MERTEIMSSVSRSIKYSVETLGESLISYIMLKKGNGSKTSRWVAGEIAIGGSQLSAPFVGGAKFGQMSPANYFYLIV
jgi:hypothetical protein